MSSYLTKELRRVYTRLRDTGADPAWTTRDEVGFLVLLGSHQEGHHSKNSLPILSKQTLLRRYLTASRKRVVWGDIDKLTCLTLAATMLAEEER